MKKIICLLGMTILLFAASAAAQITIPRASQRQAVSQALGDTSIEIVYHRPNVNGREIWGKLVPYGEVWRTGANEATVFEISGDVMINGQKLAKGKYSLHTIPTKDEWTVIFNKTWDQWGSFDYKSDADALRVVVKPLAGDYTETMTIGIENVAETTADLFISWERVRIPVRIDIGDLNKRILDNARRLLAGNPVTAARFVLDSGMKDNYAEAILWLDDSIAINRTYNALLLKARILNELGKKAEAKTFAEKALQVGKASTPPANVTGVEAFLKELK